MKIIDSHPKLTAFTLLILQEQLATPQVASLLLQQLFLLAARDHQENLY
jgi:hypothetical protein